MTADLVTVVMGRVREAESVRATELRCSKCREWLPDDSFPCDTTQTLRRGRRFSCRRCQAATRIAARDYRRAKLHAGNVPPKRVQGMQSRTLSQEKLRQFWLSRFTLDEIREMAAALDFLSTALPPKETA